MLLILNPVNSVNNTANVRDNWMWNYTQIIANLPSFIFWCWQKGQCCIQCDINRRTNVYSDCFMKLKSMYTSI